MIYLFIFNKLFKANNNYYKGVDLKYRIYTKARVAEYLNIIGNMYIHVYNKGSLFTNTLALKSF